MAPNRCLRIIAATSLLVAAATASAASRERHHHDVMRAPLDHDPRAPKERQFYPEEVENGVRGNLPFNNQMRKFSDPLNANGAGG